MLDLNGGQEKDKREDEDSESHGTATLGGGLRGLVHGGSCVCWFGGIGV